MPYDNILSRGDIGGRVPDDVIQDVFRAAEEESVILRLARRVSMPARVSSMPVLSALAQAYFVAGDTGLKQTTEISWGKAQLVAEEIAAIVPVPDAVVADVDFDLWGEVRTELVRAIARTLDLAALAGVDLPPNWPEAIIPAAIAAGNTVEQGTATAAEGGVLGDLSDLLSAVEDDGFTASGIALSAGMRGDLRRARATDGQPLIDLNSTAVHGVPLAFGAPQAFAGERGLAGQWDCAVLGIRQDVTWKLLDQAVLTDAAGNVIYNLPQQDMSALRVTMRVGFAVGVPITTAELEEGETAYPFAVLEAPGS